MMLGDGDLLVWKIKKKIVYKFLNCVNMHENVSKFDVLNRSIFYSWELSPSTNICDYDVLAIRQIVNTRKNISKKMQENENNNAAAESWDILHHNTGAKEG